MAFRTFDQPDVSRRALLRGGMLLGGMAALGGGPFARAALAQGPTWPSVRAAVNSYVAEGKVANMVAMLGWGQREAEVIASGVATFGRTQPVGQDTLYRIYSMTKPITGMAAMMLIDEGKLGLDQPVADLIPAYASVKVQKIYDGGVGPADLEPLAHPITVRHLLTHTAGLGYGIVQKGPIKTLYEDKGLIPGQVSRIPIPGLGRGKPVEGLDTFAEALATVPLVAQPGTRWAYSVSLDLLGRVIELASGQEFATFLNERIFQPCDMTSTWFRVPESEAGRLTTNYGILNGVPLPIDPAATSIYLDAPAFPFGGAGLVSSPRDYDRFLQMLVGYGKLEGRQVMSERAVRLGTSNLLPDTVTTEGTFAAGAGFGAGGRVQGTVYGWGGAAGTAAFADPERGLRGSLFTQYMPSEAYPIQRTFSELVLKDLAANRGN